MVAWILAALFFLMAVYLLQDWFRHIRRCTETVSAVIAEVEERTQTGAFRKKKQYYPVYSFRFADRDYKVVPREPAGSNKWTIGAEETLNFDPKNPEYFYVGKNLGDLIWGIVGLLLMALMLAVIFFG